MDNNTTKPLSLPRYFFIMLLCYACWVVMYYLTAWIGACRGPVFDPALPIDAKMPRAFWAVYIYFLAYIIMPGLFVIRRNIGFLNLGFTSVIIMNLIAFVLFALFPAQGPEREETVSEGIIALLYLADSRFNAFPSLHVANPWLLAFLSLKERGVSFVTSLFVFIAMTISFSTLLIRQHYILDVLGGIILAVLVAVFMFQRPVSSLPWFRQEQKRQS